MSNFQFNPADLARPRPFGISAYMRIKNEQQFVVLAIESHLPYYDEIICVYNDCSDSTESILLTLQKQHPTKIKVFHYLPKVYWIGTPEHKAMAGTTDNVHSAANYSNFALCKCTYSIATKLDADHLAIPHKLKSAIEKIRADFKAGKDKIFLFSGLNAIIHQNNRLGIPKHTEPFSGNGDIFYHRIDERSFFVNHATVEHFNHKYRYGVAAEYIGILYIHLKLLKTKHAKAVLEKCGWMPFADFATRNHIKTIEKNLKWTRRIRLALYRNKFYYNWKSKKTDNHLQIRTMRVARLINLYQDLQKINWQRDVVEPLEEK